MPCQRALLEYHGVCRPSSSRSNSDQRLWHRKPPLTSNSHLRPRKTCRTPGYQSRLRARPSLLRRVRTQPSRSAACQLQVDSKPTSTTQSATENFPPLVGSVSSTVSRRRQISHGEGRHPTYLSAVFNGPPESEPPPKRWTVFKRRQTSIHTDVSSALESPCTDLDEPTHGPATDEQPAALENNTNTSPTAENDHKYGLAPAEQSTSLRSIDIHQSSDPDRSGASPTLSVDSPYLTEETEPTEYNLTPIQEPTKPLSPIASVKVSRSYVSWFYPEEHQPPPLHAHNSLDTPSISK